MQAQAQPAVPRPKEKSSSEGPTHNGPPLPFDPKQARGMPPFP